MNIQNEGMIRGLDQVSSSGVQNNAVISQEDFLKILAAEISNPSFDSSGSGSGSQTDFMGQLIQLNMLDQMTELTGTVQTTMLMTQQQQALSLVGKEVTVAGVEDELIIGIVEKVNFANGFATIQINGQKYNIGNILEVGEPEIGE